MKESKQYTSILSFGCMCSTALFLRKNGFRSQSTIFDWLSSSLKANLQMLDDDFAHILDKDYLIQNYKDYPHIIDNCYYDVSLNHMFNEYKTFNSQIKKVKKYCNKRIKRFKSAIKSGNALLVYYSREQDECDWINANEETLKDYEKKYGFHWLFITNFELSTNFSLPHFIVPINNIHKPYGGGVSFPFENDEIIISYLKNHFSEDQILKNLKHKPSRQIFQRIIRRLQKKRGIKLKIS